MSVGPTDPLMKDWRDYRKSTVVITATLPITNYLVHLKHS